MINKFELEDTIINYNNKLQAITVSTNKVIKVREMYENEKIMNL